VIHYGKLREAGWYGRGEGRPVGLMMKHPIPEEDMKIIREIENHLFSMMDPGVEWSELHILDDPDAGKKNIQELGEKIAVQNPELAATILKLAQTLYFGYSARGDVTDYFDTVLRIGGDRVKILLFALNLFSRGKGRDARIRAAKSAGISVLGRMIAEQMNLKDDLVRKVETGGLLSQLGRSLFLKARELGMDISDEFVEKYQAHVAGRLIDWLKLDPFLKELSNRRLSSLMRTPSPCRAS
jgi:hypothetical protein